MSSPKTDPVGTVRFHPDDDPMSITARRNIKVMSTPYGPYDGHGWMELTFANGHGAGGGNCLTNDEQPPEWPVQPWWQLAAVLGLPTGQEGARPLVERRAELRDEWQDFLDDMMGSSHMSMSEVIDAKEGLREKVVELVLRLERERDQAIAHDRQPYPTAWSYEKLSEVHNELAEGLKHQLEPLVGEQSLSEHSGHQGLLVLLGQVCTMAKSGRQMSEMLEGNGYAGGGPQALADLFSDAQRAKSEALDRQEPEQSPYSIFVPGEVEEAMRQGIRAWFDVEPLVTGCLTPTGRDDVARGAAGAAFAVLEAGDLVLAPRVRSGPLVRLVVAVPPDMFISDLYARFRAAGFELRMAAEPEEG